MKTKLLLIFLILVGFFYRLYGLEENYSFWSDEVQVALCTKAILERGRPVLANGFSYGVYQSLHCWICALFTKFFGLNEFSIRFSSAIFGVLTIWAIYLLGKELFNKNVGLVAAILTTFLKIEILWSRQGRSYQYLQFFYLLGAWSVFKLAAGKRFNRGYFLGFFSCGLLASLLHGWGLFIFIGAFLYLLVFRSIWLQKWLKTRWGLLKIVAVALFPFLIGIAYFFKIQPMEVFLTIHRVNYLYYYRVFLTHNYLFLVFLALIGFLAGLLKKRSGWQLLFAFSFPQGITASFFIEPPFSRYIYPIFPFLIIFSAVGLEEITQVFIFLIKRLSSTFSGSKWKMIILLALSFLLIFKNEKFTTKPLKIYSLNEDMLDTPEVDWKKIFQFVKENMEKEKDMVLVANVNELPVWFLGEGKLNYYIKRERFGRDFLSGAKVINFLEMKEVIKKNKRGLVVLDSWDNYVPDGVREFCRDNLKKELEVDRLYPVQPRLWPVTVYSWGI